MSNTSSLLVRDIPADLHRRLRVHAASTGRTIREAVIDLLKRLPEPTS